MYVPTNIQKVEDAIARAAEVTVEEMRGRSRRQTIVDARHAVWFIAHNHFGYTSGYIGRIYGRDHTTILSGAARIRDGATDHIIDGLKHVLPEAFEDIKPESVGRRIGEWNWCA